MLNTRLLNGGADDDLFLLIVFVFDFYCLLLLSTVEASNIGVSYIFKIFVIIIRPEKNERDFKRI
jgi:hypothetical protein